MFDIGLPELLLVAAVALVVLGPEELPRVMLKIGRFVGSLKRQLGSWQDELERSAAEPRKPEQEMQPLDNGTNEPKA
jgi:sec-independent protein translocase protein TatB